jgi:hypothetical protein
MKKAWTRVLIPELKLTLAQFPTDQWAKGPLGKIFFSGQYINWQDSILQKGAMAWVPGLGLIRHYHIISKVNAKKISQVLFRKYAFWDLFLFKGVKKSSWGITKQGSWPIFEGIMIDKNCEPIAPWEFEYVADQIPGEIQSDQYLHLQNLLKYYLTKIDQRESPEFGKTQIYKDPKDGRYFQYLEASSQSEVKKIFLTYVNWAQWEHFYLEKKMAKKIGIKFQVSGEDQITLNDDADFYHSLVADPMGDICDDEGCGQVRVRYSSLCRNHHFEAVKGMPFSS